MAPRKSTLSRVRISDMPGTLRIDILALRSPIIVAFYAALLIAWLCGMVRYWPPGLLGGPPSRFGVVTDALFIGWIGGGILAAVQFLYILTGREVLDLSSSGMIVRVVMGPWNKSVHYALDDICNLRYVKFRVWEIPDGNQFSLLLPLQIGRIGFDSAGQTVRFGAGLSEPEAQGLIDRLSVRLQSGPGANEYNRFG